MNLLDRRTGTFERFVPDAEKQSTKGGNFIHSVLADQTDRLRAVGNQHVTIYNESTHSLQEVRQVIRMSCM